MLTNLTDVNKFKKMLTNFTDVNEFHRC